MALVSHRDPEDVKRAILPWLQARLSDAEQIDLPTPRKPDAGGSSDTYFLSPRIVERGRERQEDWVLRIENTGFQVYQHPTIERQYRVMRVLKERSNVPVPAMIWYEPDRRTLGESFFVMQRVVGQIPSYLYHADGFLTQVTPAARAAIWLSAVEALAGIHRTDLESFRFLSRPQFGATGLDQEIALWDGYLRWSGAPVRPIQQRARQWLLDHVPSRRPTGLAWGDARIGNMVFHDNRCVAVIDWETVSLGGAESDLGWWLFYDWMVSEGWGVPRLEGLGEREDTIKAWEEFASRQAFDLAWHEMFATWRFSLISDRARHLMRMMQMPDPLPADLKSPPAERLAMLLSS
jgi:aminoglycoside phosphotransferase (APT) family kinase protein